MKTKILSPILVLVLILGGLAAAQDKGKDKELYDAAKKAIYQKDWTKALADLETLDKNFVKSEFRGESLYWLGYSLNKMAESIDDSARGLEMKKTAIDRLNTLLSGYAASAWAKDAKILRVEIAEDLYKNGLKNYGRYINGAVAGGVEGGVFGGVEGGVQGGIIAGLEGRMAEVRTELDAAIAGQYSDRDKNLDPDTELKLVALNALMGMDKEKAFPILEKMVRGDKSPALREHALFVLSQSNDPKVTPLLADLAAKDPSDKVREQAVFWLGQRHDDAGFGALIGLYGSADKKIREKILFSLSQMKNPQATAKLIEIAKSDPEIGLRANAVFWLSQRHDDASQASLFDLYDAPADLKIKENLIMGFSQNGNAKARAKLFEIARSDKDLEAREKAIFWIGQMRGDDAEAALLDIYRKTDDAKLKKQVIFAFSQHGGDKAAAKLVELARGEKDPEVKKQIIFWLGQSKSDEAVKFLREILDK